MTDYGRPVQFGFFPVPEAAARDQVLADVRYADQAGLDLVGIQDHPYQRRYLDTFTLIPWLGAQTQRIRFLTDVANLPLRLPSVLAKAAATVDVLTDGRFELGLGAGAFWDAIVAYGGPRRPPGEAVSALEEAMTIIRLMWSDERSANVEGSHYAVRGAKPGPRPAHDIGIWLGASGPRMLTIVGRLADGWVPSSSWAPPQRLAELHARIDEAAAGAGRDPAALVRAYNLNGTITDGRSDGFLSGPVSQWADELTELVVDGGMDTFIFWGDDQNDPGGQLRLFAEEVRPAVRDAVAAERSR
jgi:alkanesulfonate monooxygenase SsuD/methylene tetrahydromethanopterin reductase-like flavin-dependent oxidoreductase (luciferase family)